MTKAGKNGCHGLDSKGHACGKAVMNAEATLSPKSLYCEKHFKENRRHQRQLQRELTSYEELQQQEAEMRDEAEGMSEAEMAAYYQRTHDVSGFVRRGS